MMNPNSLFPAVAYNLGRSENNIHTSAGNIACKVEQVMSQMNDAFLSPIHKYESCIMNQSVWNQEVYL